MKIINSRYRMVRQLYDEYSKVKNYVALDLWKNDKPVCLSIVKRDIVPQIVFDFLKDNFLQFSEMKSSYYLQNLGFENITTIDNEIQDKKSFLYVSELIENKESLYDYAYGKDVKTLLKIMIQICQGSNFACLNGMLDFTDLAHDFFVVLNEKYEPNVKIRDFISVMMNRYIGSPLFFSYTDAKHVDLVGLGMLFIGLFEGYNADNSLEVNIDSIKNHYLSKNLSKYETRIFDCLIHVIRKMVLQQYTRFNYVFYEIISEINTMLDTFFVADSDNVFDSVCFKPKLVAWEKDVSDIVKLCSSFRKLDNDVNTFIIQGEVGSGKSRFLEEVAFLLSIDGLDVYSFDMQNKNGVLFWLSFLASIFDHLPDLHDDYNLEDIIKEIQNLDYLDSQYDVKKYKLVYKITSVMEVLSRKHFVTITIDNFDYADEFTIEIFLTIILQQNLSEHMMFVFSLSKIDFLKLSTLSILRSAYDKSDRIKLIDLEPLTAEQTGLFIRQMLLMNFAPMMNTRGVYNITGGNPFFSMHVVKELLKRGGLIKNKDDGIWQISNSIYDISNILTSENDRLIALRTQLNSLVFEDTEVIRSIFAFKHFIKMEYLYTLLPSYTQSEIDTKVLNFANLGLLKHCYEDSYIINNKIVQNMVYTLMPDAVKCDFHFKISQLIIDDEIDGMEELVYHLQGLKQYEKVVELLLKLCEKKQIKNDFYNAVLDYEKALYFLGENTELKFSILLKMGGLYFKIGRIKDSISIYDSAGKLLEFLTSDVMQIQYYLDIANIFLKTGLDLKFKNAMEKLNTLIPDISDIKLKIRYDILLALESLSVSKYHQTQDQLNIIMLELNRRNDLNEFYADVNYMFGTLLFFQNQPELALKKYNETYDQYNNNNDVSGMLLTSHHIANVYGYLYGDYDNAIMRYKKIIDEANSLGLYRYATLAMLDLSIVYVYKTDIANAEYYCDMSLNNVLYNTTIDDSQRLIAIYLYYTILCYKNKYSEARKYYDKLSALKEKKIINFFNFDIIFNFYLVRASSFYDFGMYDAENKTLQTSRYYISNENLEKIMLVDFRLEINKIMNGNTYSFQNILSYLHRGKSRLPKHILNKMVMYAFNLVKTFIIKQKFQEIKIFAQELLEFCGNDFNYSIFNSVCIDLINAYLYTNRKENLLLRALKTLDNQDLLNLKITINIQLCCTYFENNKIGLGILKCIETEKMIEQIMSYIDNDKKLDYFNFNSYKIPYSIIYKFLSHNPIKISTRLLNEKVSYVGMRKLLNSKDDKMIFNNKEAIDIIIMDVIENGNIGCRYIKENSSYLSLNYLHNIRDMLLAMKTKFLASDANIVFLNSSGQYNFLLEPDSTLMPADKLLEILNANGIKSIARLEVKNDFVFLVIPVWSEYRISPQYREYFIFAIKKPLIVFHEVGLQSYEKNKMMLSFFISLIRKEQYLYIDKATMAMSREYFDSKLFLEYSTGHFSDPISCIYADIDHFTYLYEKYGNIACNDILKEVVIVIKKYVSIDCIVCRYGIDKFVLILNNKNNNVAMMQTEEIRIGISNHQFHNITDKITASFGVATYPDHAQTIEKLVMRSEQACNFAKKTGIDSVVVWTTVMSAYNNIEPAIPFVNTDKIYDIQKWYILHDIIVASTNYSNKYNMLYKFVHKLLDIFHAKYAAILMNLNENDPTVIGTDESFSIDTLQNNTYIKEVLSTQKGVCKINWENTSYNQDNVPIWESFIIAPIFYDQNLKGLVYLISDAKEKAFAHSDFNYLSSLAMIVSKEL